MGSVHHQKLPEFSTLLSGRTPPDEVGFRSDRLQIWYHNTAEVWNESVPHAHQQSDEVFIVLRGALVVEVEDERFIIGPHEFCCFPQGVYHRIVEVHPPVESLVIRAPLGDDKVYRMTPAH